MKNISFKRNESLLRGISDTQVKNQKKPRNWDRIVYLILLALLLFYLGRFFVNRYLYVEADGQILFDNLDIRTIDDSRITRFHVKESDEVKEGDSLFTYRPDDFAKEVSKVVPESSSETTKQGDVSWAEREFFAAEQELELNAYTLNEKRKMRKLFEQDVDRMSNEVMLDVLPKSVLDDKLARIRQLDFEMNALESKNNLLRSSLSRLNGMKRNLSYNSVKKSKGKITLSDSQDKLFRSPISGTVTRILKSEFEVALRDEVILSIHRPLNVYVKGFFKQEDLKSLKENDEVTLLFPDGSEGKGIIKRFYFTTYRLPEEFQKKYEPVTRSLSADIYPASSEDFKKWNKYWKLGVKIKKFKY